MGSGLRSCDLRVARSSKPQEVLGALIENRKIAGLTPICCQIQRGYGTACGSKRVTRADDPVATATGSVPKHRRTPNDIPFLSETLFN